MGWTQQTFQAELQRRCRIRYHLSTNEGSIEVSGTNHFDGRTEPDGWPAFMTRLQVSTGPYHFQAELNDRMLGHLVDLVLKFLERPQPPVNVRVELVAPPAPPAPLELVDQVVALEGTANYDDQDGKEAIKRRMLGVR